MWTPDQWRFLVGVIGNIISAGLFLSPIPTFVKIFKAKSVQEFQAWPYLATIFNCVMWVYYGTPFVTHANVLVATINGAGIVIEFIYLSFFIAYSSGGKRRTILFVLLAELVAFLAIILGTLLGTHKVATRGTVIGIIACVLNVAMYCSPLMIMFKVIKTKSVEYMPFLLSLANFLNGCVWTGYAFFHMDPYLYVPNGLGAIAGLAQLILYGCYYRSTPKKSEIELSQESAV